jgi:carbamoyltransferase
VKEAVEYCLASEGIGLADVEMIAASDTLANRARADFGGRSLKLFRHHLCHAASAYLALPTRGRTGIVVYDGYGTFRSQTLFDGPRLRETVSFFLFSDQGYQSLGTTYGQSEAEEDDFPAAVTNSVGLLYELVTSLLGWNLMDTGKTMGLASYGSPRHLAALEEHIVYGDTMSDCFACPTGASGLTEALESVLDAGRGSFETRADLAASVQAVVNKVLVNCARLLAPYQIEHLAVSGGCGLNTVANAHLVAQSPPDIPVTIAPHCGDAGLGLGALWLGRHEAEGAIPDFTFQGGATYPGLCRPGRLYSLAERQSAAQQFYPRLVADPAMSTPEDLAAVLAEGRIIGVLQGRSEIGPRALGGRSILADPRRVQARERINRLMKRREPFRPLAPIILEADYEDYFADRRQADPFMLKVSNVLDRCRREAPAVVHVDGTARVQIIDEKGAPFLAALLKAFKAQTGVGILVNTSFNRRGEPIVETPMDAIDAFLGLGLDGLYLDGDFYWPADLDRPSA